jgi:hypothetical protein
MVPGGSFVCETPPGNYFNLPFVLAYGVLDEVLKELILQGAVPRPGGSRVFLGDRMQVAASALSWIDFISLDQGRMKRNNVAHKGVLLDGKECIFYVEAIQREFEHWRLI